MHGQRGAVPHAHVVAVVGSLELVVAAIPVQADVTDPEGQRALMTAAEEVLGPVGVLVNNAGGDLQREFHHLTRDDLERMLRVNLSAPIELAHLLLPGMLQRGRGHIVNISSFAGRTGLPHTQAYAAAKDGLIGFTRVMRTDYRRAGVSASVIVLGPIREAGTIPRTLEETGVQMPRLATTSPPNTVAKAVVRAIRSDKAEIVVMPGPGRFMKALMDLFPSLGTRMNRAVGARTLAGSADRASGGCHA